ncbi:hypothetical protein KPH14_012955 [Odynerus spinipes]|uniref:Uncharacterized protein n=1 Tax=Odynerus spinipes TaxID=1348599 RepID=A0AAD9R7U7_9HYME|nr:hypothetical protein KPH14_012955 [Odynerus spinipes]
MLYFKYKRGGLYGKMESKNEMALVKILEKEAINIYEPEETNTNQPIQIITNSNFELPQKIHIDPVEIDEYNLSGSRHSGKTTAIAIELSKIITAVQTTNIKVAIYPFRYFSRQVNELVNEVKIALDHIKNKENRLLFTPNKFVGGGDFGISDSPLGHPATAVLIGVNYDNTKYHIMKEFYHSNSEFAYKDTIQLANDFVEFYLKAIEEFKINQPITIYCDYGGGGLAFIHNVEAIIKNNMLANKINIVKVDKKTMNMIKYKDVKNEETYKPEMVDLYDDL